jgi:hypothetical protein
MEDFFSFTPPRYQQSSCAIAWPEEVEDGLNGLNRQIRALESQRTDYLRRRAHELGLAAKNLADLRSERGRPYQEVARRDRDDCRRAQEQDGERANEEWAYWCGYEWPGGPREGCGWVKGVPRSEAYNEIGLLAGAAGERHCCRICGAEIGETKHLVS